MKFSKNINISSIGKALILCTAVTFMSCNDDDTQTISKKNNLVWEDDFNVDGAPDASKWTLDIGTGSPALQGWGNNELQYYTDREENVHVENGYLVINARKEAYQGANYTSARLNTKGKFDTEYGRIEARMRLPYGQGLWPAFWMLGEAYDPSTPDVWPNCGEIDIMENRGQEPNKITGSVHGPGYSAADAVHKDYTLQNDRFDTGFHVFGIEWGKNYINYYVDGDLYNQIKPEDVPGEWVFNQPFFLLINLAVGGNYVGNPNETTEFPQTLLVDYVRVYN